MELLPWTPREFPLQFILEEAKREFEIRVFVIPWWKLLRDLLSPPIPPPETPHLPSAVHSGTPLGCSGDKDALSCFLGELHPSCTLPYFRAWVVLGKGTWNHLSPSLHAEETKAPEGEVAFPSQFTCQDRTHDESQPRVQPTRP